MMTHKGRMFRLRKLIEYLRRRGRLIALAGLVASSACSNVQPFISACNPGDDDPPQACTDTSLYAGIGVTF